MNKKGWWIFGRKSYVGGNKSVKNREVYLQIANKNFNNALINLNHLKENSTHIVNFGGTRDDAVFFKSKIDSAIASLNEVAKLLK